MIVTLVETVTAFVEITKFAALFPAATVTDAGTEATAGFELASVTASGAAGTPPRRSVPVIVSPPFTEDAVKIMPLSAAGWTPSTADFVTPLAAMEIVTEEPVATGCTVIAVYFRDVPAVAVNCAGTEAAAGFELVSVTVWPPAGAGAER